jgi:hypothetical protein
MTLRKDLHEANRVSWNEATRAHNAHKREQAAFAPVPLMFGLRARQAGDRGFGS